MITPGYKIIKSIKEIALEESIIFDFEMGSDSKDVPAYLWHHKDVYFLMLSITTDYNNNYILPLNKAYGYPVPSKKDLLELIDICEDDSIRKINHNIKFDMHCLRRLVGQEIKWTSKTLWDTQIIGHLIDSTELKSLANWTEIYAPQFAGYKENMDYSLKTPFKKMADYAITDTHITGILDDEFYTILENDEVLLNHYLIYCQPSLLSLFLAEENGAHIDRKQVERWIIKGDKYAEEKIIELNNEPNVEKYKHYKRRSLRKKKIDDINEKLDKHKEGSKQFEKYIKKIKDIKSGKLNLFPKVNFGSPKQMSELLFGKYGFGFRGTSTSEEALKEIGIDFTESLLDLRAINKINGTYFKGIEKNLTEDNKLHCSFNLAGTATGRLSSSDPNLQNIPKHVKREDVKEYIKAVRSFFIAPEDYYFFQADFSQAELRMIANISKDETMIEAYLNDVDIHANTGAYFAGMTLDQFYDSDEKTFGENRQIAKSANFGIIYGMYPKGYMRYVYNNTGRRITMQEAEYQINSFFRLYKNLKKWHYASIRAARSLGYSETFFGRRLYLPDINNKNKEEWGKRSAAERNAINMPIQGTVGELTVWAGNFICAECHPSTKYILNVHDSVNGYIRKDKIKSELALIKDIMENLPVKEYFGRELGPVPMKVDIEYGTSWLDLKKYEI